MTVDTREVEFEDGASKGRYLYRGAAGAAEMTLSRASAKLIIIEHTDVPDGLRGLGVGQAMVLRAVEDARATDARILPLCPFAAAQFRHHPDWADVLYRRPTAANPP